MREYKFRGKASISIEELNELGIKHENGWVCGHFVQDDRGNPFIVGNVVEATDEYVNLEYWVPVIPETVGMFTGETDKNGKEIYEGDLLTDYGEAPPLYVEYSEKHGAYCFVDKFDPSGTVYYTPLMIYYEQMEVIGNVYENPELLEEE